MNLGDVERELRFGPPEEAAYRIRELVLDDLEVAPVQSIGGRRRLIGVALGGAMSMVGIGILVVALTLGAFAVGRLTAPNVASPAAAPSEPGLVEPAVVSEALRQAFYSGADREHAWLVCSTAPSLTCADAPVYATGEPLGFDAWPSLRPIRAPAGDIVVGLHMDPAVPVWAYLIAAATPTSAGSQLVPVTVQPGDTFLDLGRLTPGRYVVSVLTDPTALVMSGQSVIGVVVT